jgi:hypothetical protein
MANKNSVSKLKIFKYSSNGMMLPVVLLVAVVGAYILTSSHAATVSYSEFLNAGSAAQTAGVNTVTDVVNQIGPQSVSQVSSGAQLDYLTGGKVALARWQRLSLWARAAQKRLI